MIKLFQLLKLCVVLLIGGHCNAQDYQLVWSDEFNKDGCLDESIWNYEQGYARNEELQWYQSDNAPDFITFLRHHIAHNDNQRVT